MSKLTKVPLATGKIGNATSSKRTKDATPKAKTKSTSVSNTKQTIPTKTALKPEEEKKIIKKPVSTINSQTLRLKTQKSIPGKIALKARSLNQPEAVEKSKPQPPRSKQHSSVPNPQKIQQPVISKQNVMNLVHNVTVSSPPPVKREIAHPIAEVSTFRERTKTRTLQPDEILILKQQTTTGPESLGSIPMVMENKVQHDSCLDLSVKEPVAFEVLFDENRKDNKLQSKVRSKNDVANVESSSEIPHISDSGRCTTSSSMEKEDPGLKDDPTENSSRTDDVNYEDDFESYESDFETGSSSSTARSENAADSARSSPELSEPDESSAASEETQLPITVIHKDDERKLDSGSYDMNSRKLFLQQHQQQLDSIDTSTGNSDQLDSGISYSAPSSSLQRTNPASNTAQTPPKISKRGQELMSKIQLDNITFVLFDLKPVKYEFYMKLYGNFNSTQMSTQTNDDRSESSIQTDTIVRRSMWTQHPPQFDLKFMRENDFHNLKNACGEFELDWQNTEEIEDPLSRSLSAMSRFRSARTKSAPRSSQTDFVQLRHFLHRTQFTLALILNKSSVRKNLHNANLTISQGYYNLNSQFLSATKVIKIFSNSKSKLLVVVHDDVEGVYSGEFRNLLSVWDINEPKSPFKLLSTWSQVSRAEICAEQQDIIVAGLDDGSIALWDLEESSSFGVQFGDGSCYFPPTQTVTPCLGGAELNLRDLGVVIDIKMFRSSQQLSKLQVYRPIQFASLNDSGVLTIWTLVNLEEKKWTVLRPNKIDNSKMEYNSPTARFKLTQSDIYNLCDYSGPRTSRPKSSFEKTRSYFENDLFSDNALKELQETQKGQADLIATRFTGFDVGIERIYVSTNRDFILSCTKTLKSEKFRKIAFENSKGLSATALKLLWNEEFLIVGFSNGSIVVYNCNQQKVQKDDKGISVNLSDSLVSLDKLNRNAAESEVGKSCAIQNLVRNEKEAYRGRPDSCLATTRPTTAFDTNSVNVGTLFDKQVLLGGTVLRKDLVNAIEVTDDGNRLLALMDGNLRIYDFTTNTEVPCNTSNSIGEIGLTKETFGRRNLAVLTRDGNVQIHIIK